MRQSTLRVATYNVHGCVGTDRRRSETRIAEVIASMSVDVVGLQELDRGRRRSAGVDQAQLIARQLGWHFLFEPALREGGEQYGNAIISRYPLSLVSALALPGRGSWYCRETRGAIWAVMETEHGPVQIVNSHFGLGRSERLLQAEFLADSLGQARLDSPLLLLGDFNSRSSSPAILALQRNLCSLRALLPAAAPCRTFPTRFPIVAVDHIFVNRGLKPISLAVYRTALARVASDHFPLVAELESQTDL